MNRSTCYEVSYQDRFSCFAVGERSSIDTLFRRLDGARSRKSHRVGGDNCMVCCDTDVDGTRIIISKVVAAPARGLVVRLLAATMV